MRSTLTTIIELLGAACVTAAAWQVDARLGLLVAGVLCVAIGFLLERG